MVTYQKTKYYKYDLSLLFKHLGDSDSQIYMVEGKNKEKKEGSEKRSKIILYTEEIIWLI